MSAPPALPPRRRLVVQRTLPLGPRLRRIVLGGPELAGFASPGFDDHIKLFFPSAEGPPAMRDFTPSLHDPARDELAIDFALHAHGPATDWARDAASGDILEIGGPRGTRPSLHSEAGEWLIGDMTALPAIARRLRTLPPGRPVVALIEAADPSDEMALDNPGGAEIRWVHRCGAAPGSVEPLRDALHTLALPDGCVAWIAAEITVARALRTRLIEDHAIARERIRAAGYWRLGAVGTHTRIEE